MQQSSAAQQEKKEAELWAYLKFMIDNGEPQADALQGIYPDNKQSLCNVRDKERFTKILNSLLHVRFEDRLPSPGFYQNRFAIKNQALVIEDRRSL